MKSARNSRVLTIVIFLILAFWAGAAGLWFAGQKMSAEKTGPGSGFSYEPEFDPGESSGSDASSSSAAADQNRGSAGQTASNSNVTWDKERWSGIYIGDDKIGYGVSRLAAAADGWLVMERSRIKLKVMDTEQDLFFNVQARLDRDFHLLELDQEVLSGFMTMKNHAVRDGDNINIEITSAGETKSHTLNYDHPLGIDTIWLYENEVKGKKPGDEVVVNIFEPLLLTELPMTITMIQEDEIRIDDKKFSCYKARISVGKEVQWIWIDRQSGEIIKQHVPSFGFTTLVEDKEKATNVDWAKAKSADDLLLALVVKADRPITRARSVTYFKARLEGASLEGLDLDDPPRQILQETTIEVRSEEAIPAIGYELPIQDSMPKKAAELKTELEPTPFIQSDDQRIKKQAVKAVGGARDAVTAVDRLLAFVSDYVVDSMVYSIPSALEVLNKKKGACKEHTILFVALARALGIPARPVTGIVYTDTMTIDGFYYHAWAEVYLSDPEGEGAWVAVDPTFNQNPADATHIMLKRGGIEGVIDMMHLMGALRVEVEDYR